MDKTLAFYFKLGSVLALAVLAGDVYLSASFGWSINPMMMLIMGAVSLASGILMIFAAYYWVTNYRVLAVALAVAWLPAFAANVWSNVGVSTAVRMADVQQANVQQTTYDEIIKGRDALESKVAMLAGQRDDLIAKRGWTAAVPVDVLEAKLAAFPGIQADIWRRTRECTNATIPASVAYCRQYANLQADVAAAKSIAALNKQIADTERGLNNARTELAQTDPGISSTQNQSMLHANLLTGSLSGRPSQAWVEVANNGTGIVIAVVVALLSASMTLSSVWLPLVNLARQAVGTPPAARYTAPTDRPITVQPEPVTYPARQAEPHRLRLTTIAQLRRLATSQPGAQAA